MIELNVDALVGPTHHYGGLSYGNVASLTHQHEVSNPKVAALEGLEKAWRLACVGIQQVMMPPLIRPDCDVLRQLGFVGSDLAILRQAYETDPRLVTMCCSASSMWMANAATVTPSIDHKNSHVHISLANLVSQLHRSIEPKGVLPYLKHLFPASNGFVCHDPLPLFFGDEGAANHTRFCAEDGSGLGLHLFVYGRTLDHSLSQSYPARQFKEASEAIVRRHGLDVNHVVMAQQHPDAIDEGVFHHDVISVGHRMLLMIHEKAFFNQEKVLNTLQEKSTSIFGQPLDVFCVTDSELSLKETVQSYLFNSQLVTVSDGSMMLVATQDCDNHPKARKVIERLINEKNPVQSVQFVPLQQSMSNGGGPACLRLRVVLTEEELFKIYQPWRLTSVFCDKLRSCVDKLYPEKVTLSHFLEPEYWHQVTTIYSKLNTLFSLS